MTLPSNPLAYADCYDAMEAALMDEMGVRIRFGNLIAARYFRLRCHTARKVDRERNAKTYPIDSPLHHSSTYDILVHRLRQDEGSWWLYIEKITTLPGEIESLSGAEVQHQLPSRTVPALPAPEPDPHSEDALAEGLNGIEARQEVLPPLPKVRRV